MIIKGSSRGGAKALATHLLRTDENDHVEVHELRGFLSEDLTEAFKEVQAISKGTRCRQPFFSVSLNPPPEADATVDHFVAAANKIEAETGLEDHPRAIVFHEKDGRRHAHVVWSRIDAETMTARRMSHFKTKLNKVARQMHFECGWKLPRGFLDKAERSPFTVDLAEWQAAKRRGKNAIDQKMLVQSCWAASDDRASFAAILQDHGFRLAKGNRRSHVIVAHDGQVLAVARSLGKKAKEVKARLGDPDDLPSVEQALDAHRQDVRTQFGRFAGDIRQDHAAKRARLDAKRTAMIAQHRQTRTQLIKKLALRAEAEAIQSRARIKTGLAGLWQRLTGKRSKVLRENAAATVSAQLRDQAEKEALSQAQLAERKVLEDQRTQLRREALGLLAEIRSDRDHILEALQADPAPTSKSRRRTQTPAQTPELRL